MTAPSEMARITANPRIWLLVGDPPAEWEGKTGIRTGIATMTEADMTFHDSLHVAGNRPLAVAARAEMERAEREYRALYEGP
jgi:hypothetical protein